MFIDLTLVPVPQWTHREFDGVDPWAEDRPVRWRLVVCKVVSTTVAPVLPVERPSVPPGSNAVPRRLAVGLVEPDHDRVRVLPLAVQALWRAGEVRDDELPVLLQQIEDPLRLSDYPPSLARRVAAPTAWVCGVLAVIALAIYGAFAPPAGHEVQYFKTADWLRAPIRREHGVLLARGVPPLAVVELPAPVRPPAGVQTDSLGGRRRVSGPTASAAPCRSSPCSRPRTRSGWR